MLRNLLFFCVFLSTLASPGQTVDSTLTAQLLTVASLDEPSDRERLYWQLPLQTIDSIGVRAGMTVADVGAGDGYFSLRLAVKVGERGKVFATEISREALEKIGQKSSLAVLQNIETVEGTGESCCLPDSSCDVVLMVNTLHCIGKKGDFLRSVSRALKRGGYVAVVQWSVEKMLPELPGWAGDNRDQFLAGPTIALFESCGFKLVKTIDFLPVQDVFLFALTH